MGPLHSACSALVTRLGASMKSMNDYAREEWLERVLESRRDAFCQDYGVTDKPALVWQCLPTDDVVVNPASESLQEAIREGASAVSDAAWWYAFKSHRRPVFIFDGLASSAVDSATEWATEVHRDGHFIAGLWSFPDRPPIDRAKGKAVADFYADAFSDFGYVAGKIAAAASYTGPMVVTCTMLRSDELPLIATPHQIVVAAVRRKQLRWPLIFLEVPTLLTDACLSMATQFMQTYGRALRR